MEFTNLPLLFGPMLLLLLLLLLPLLSMELCVELGCLCCLPCNKDDVTLEKLLICLDCKELVKLAWLPTAAEYG